MFENKLDDIIKRNNWDEEFAKYDFYLYLDKYDSKGVLT
jgi:hypothetical protein